MKRLKKMLLLLPLALLMAASAVPAYAAPYEGYNYSWWGDPEPAPVPYLPAQQVDGKQLGIGSFNAPEDLFVTADNQIYVLDTGNNRIVQLNERWQVVRIIDQFEHEGQAEQFARPQGIFVTREGSIYVADTGNKRVVELDPDGRLVRIIGAPQADVIKETFIYEPIKLIVDSAKRLYVVGKGVFDGIMQFDSGGKFTGFMGVNRVQYSPIDLFWKRVMTEQQRSKMVLFIPVEFNNVDIDEEGFIYATTGEAGSSEPVKRLNPSGTDVLKRIGYFNPKGDIRVRNSGARPGPSSISAVTVDRNGIYNILDNTRGRIFTYDRDGKLMYIYGLLGEQLGTFKTPVALEMLGDRMLVLDKGHNHLVVFEPTRYGTAIRDAVIYNDLGDEEKSVAAWNEALKLNRNLEIAYVGIGKALLRTGDNYAAMEHFKLGAHRDYYSRAFERYRKEFMWEHFGKIAGGVLAGIAALIIAAKLLGRRKEREPGVIGMAWYTIFHPFKGFYDLKYERKGKVWFAMLLLLILSILYVMKKQYSGFIFNPVIDGAVSTIDEIKFIVLPFFLWCIANWSTTTLMEGEGKFKDIVIATAYALVPLILVQIPMLLLSNILTKQEGSFYYLIESFAFLWVFGLLFVGMLTVHQYTPAKTVATAILTFIVIGIIVFIGLLFFSLAQQMLSFGSAIYKEIMFRIGEG